MQKIGFIKSSYSQMDISLIASACLFNHYFCIGETGSGKTASFILPMMQQRLNADHSLLVFDEKNTLHLSLKHFAIQQGVGFDLIAQLGTPEGVKINLIAGMGEKGFEDLARILIKETSDPHWAASGRAMFVRCSVYYKELMELMVRLKHAYGVARFTRTGYLGIKNGLSLFQWKKGIDDPSLVWIEYDVDLESRPMVIKDIAELFNDSKAFAVFVIHAATLLRGIQESYTKIATSKTLIEQFKRVQDEAAKLKSYAIRLDMSEASGNNGTHYMVTSSIKSMMDPVLNDPKGIDINQYLEEGKHLVINCEALSHEAIGIILEMVLSRFKHRAKLSNKQPVSVIIDEAYRVLQDGSSDLHTDILREAKVELILSAQNEAQMIDRLGETRWKVFGDNFVNRLKYSTAQHPLKTFHYLDERSEKVHKADPIFIEQASLMEAECAYQNLHQLYRGCRRNDNEVAIYDRHLFEYTQEVIIRNIKTGKEELRRYGLEEYLLEPSEEITRHKHICGIRL